MEFDRLLADLPLSPGGIQGDAAVDVRRACADSRRATQGDLFVCMPSASRDTHEFLPQVAASGAAAALTHSVEGADIAAREGLAGAFFSSDDLIPAASHAAWKLQASEVMPVRLIGITGTNGKTTVASAVAQSLGALGRSCGYLGTLGFGAGGDLRELPNTTPFPVEAVDLYCEASRAGCHDLAMEVSSHALEEGRLAAFPFSVGVFTNLSQDHLDFHVTMQAYAAAKKRLFTHQAGPGFRGAVNIGDCMGREWAQELDVLTFGAPDADLVFEAHDISASRIRGAARFEGAEQEIDLSLGGLFNVENGAAALATLLCCGCSLAEAAEGLRAVRAVPGRFEGVSADHPFDVIVDYAHTPDALAKLLEAVRALHPRRVITVFGCGGDRDPVKRPLMAQAASKGSDICILTSDNPRTEDPQKIIDDAKPGLDPGTQTEVVILRPEAIERAIRIAQPGDAVVIAGKGHEDYQIIGRTKHPMDDRKLAREALEACAR